MAARRLKCELREGVFAALLAGIGLTPGDRAYAGSAAASDVVLISSAMVRMRDGGTLGDRCLSTRSRLVARDRADTP